MNFGPFLNHIVSLLLGVMDSLHILVTSPLLDMTFASIFSQSGTCLLIFLSLRGYFYGFFYGFTCTSHSGVGT